MSAKQNRLLATMERKQKLMSEVSDEIQRRLPKEVLVSQEKISEVENSSRCKEGRWSRRSRGSLTRPGSVWTGGQCQGPNALKVKLHLQEPQNGGRLLMCQLCTVCRLSSCHVLHRPLAALQSFLTGPDFPHLKHFMGIVRRVLVKLAPCRPCHFVHPTCALSIGTA